MPIFELGYRPWEGTPRSPWIRWWTITRTGIALGYKNRMLRGLLILSILPLLYYAPLFMAMGNVTDPLRPKDLDQDGWFMFCTGFFGMDFTYALMTDPASLLPAAWATAFTNYFIFVQIWGAMVILSVVGPPIVAQDVRSKAFLLYFSKPIGRWEYIAGKAGILFFFISLVTLLPALALVAMAASYAPTTAALVQLIGIAGRVVAASAVVMVPLTLAILALSSLTKESRIAAFLWMMVFLVGEIFFRILQEAPGTRKSDWILLTSFHEPVRAGVSLVLDAPGRLAAMGWSGRLPDAVTTIATPYPYGMTMAFLAAVSIVSLAVIFRRVSAPMRI